MDPIEYLFLQMKLEGKGYNQDGLITSLGPVSEDIPLVILAKVNDGKQVSFYGSSLPIEIQDDISSQKITFSDGKQLFGKIRSNNIPVRVGHYKTYIFPDIFEEQNTNEVICLSKTDTRAKDFGFDKLGNSVYALLSGGVIISACVSTRQNNECAESWVYTSPENRRMGFAKKVVIAWAKENKLSNIIPFYSHEIDNIASMKLANKLGLMPVFEEVIIERMLTP
jgi:RimJ/RimL family protein N-acetyltransferase